MKKRFDLDRSFDQLIKIMLKVESIQSTRRKWVATNMIEH